MLRGGKFFRNSMSEASIEHLPNEMLLSIFQRTAASRKDKNSVSLVSRRFREVSEDKSVGKHLTDDINFIIDCLLHDLYRLGFKPRAAESRPLCADKELVQSIERLKKQLAAVMNAQYFEKIDNLTLGIFSNGDAKKIQSNSLLKYKGLLPYVIDSVEDFQFITATVDKSQRNAIEVIFKATKLSEKNEVTTRIHLMLRIYAELKNKKFVDKHRDYKELLTDTCSKLVTSLSKEQQIIAMQMIKDGVRLSEELYLHHLANTFIAVCSKLQEQWEDDASNDISVSLKPSS